VRVEGPRSLIIPDRPGNNRLDSFRNIVSGSGEVGLLFFVPGIDDALRLNGRASLTTEASLLAHMVEFGKLPRAALQITVREVYLHCPKAIMRAQLWSPDTHVSRDEFPSLGTMIREQTGMGEGSTTAQEVELFKTQL
jgi:uncharacterized protein